MRVTLTLRATAGSQSRMEVQIEPPDAPLAARVYAGMLAADLERLLAHAPGAGAEAELRVTLEVGEAGGK